MKSNFVFHMTRFMLFAAEERIRFMKNEKLAGEKSV